MAGISKTQIYSLLPLMIFLLASFSDARDHVIGGKPDAWRIPTSDSDTLNHWAEKSRFLIGDSLVWKNEGSNDSVLQVTRRDYVTCNTSSPVGVYNAGRVELERSGPYYFISGVEGNCRKGQKVIVVVMHRRLAVSPSPSPAEVAPAPTSGGDGVIMRSRGFLALGLTALVVVVGCVM
ncbi:early nodulin-like protein [Striga asiatica]|uniref:Early nodulin-like protein n=1 Tax=Striga asiatica TaxID=4170 RepID=A0A5A7PVI6_STRAF|nr:early nodulin-like protein [Striga asiatica]